MKPSPRPYRLHVRRAAFPGTDCPPPRAYGPRRVPGAHRRCRLCTRPVAPESRRHVCPRCERLQKAGTLPLGACAVCGTPDRRVLSMVEVEGAPVILCANDAALLGPLVVTLADVRAEAARGHTAPLSGLRLELEADLDGAELAAEAA